MLAEQQPDRHLDGTLAAGKLKYAGGPVGKTLLERKARWVHRLRAGKGVVPEANPPPEERVVLNSISGIGWGEKDGNRQFSALRVRSQWSLSRLRSCLARFPRGDCSRRHTQAGAQPRIRLFQPLQPFTTLSAVIDAWPELPVAIKAGILAMVKTVKR
jgi:hypothetical protein